MAVDGVPPMAAVSREGVEPVIPQAVLQHAPRSANTPYGSLFRNPVVPETATKRVVGLLPVLDEVNTIETVVRSILESGCVERLLVVDDNSTDGTLPALRAAQREFPQLDVVVRTEERGLGTALLFGFEEALRRYPFERLVVLDADLSHDPAIIPRLLSARADLVIGSRYAPGGRIENWPASRRVISLLANSAARWLLSLPVWDVTSGFRIYSRRTVQAVVNEAACGGYEFQVEVVWLATRHDFSIAEAPIAFVERKAGKSKLRTGGEMGRFLRFVLQKSLSRTIPRKRHVPTPLSAGPGSGLS